MFCGCDSAIMRRRRPQQNKEDDSNMKDPKFKQLYEMAKKELLQDILPFWMEHDVDE